jgi:hypothetical protein
MRDILVGGIVQVYIFSQNIVVLQNYPDVTPTLLDPYCYFNVETSLYRFFNSSIPISSIGSYINEFK